MKTKGLTLVCYDISRDGTRNKLADALEKIGTRVQFSVFEVRGQRRKLERICRQFALSLRAGDSIRLYPLAQKDFGSVQVFGDGPPVEAEEFYLF